MKTNFSTYNPVRLLNLIRGVIAFMLIVFVLLKPIRAAIIDYTGDKIELSANDIDETDTEEQNSEEEGSEEDPEEEKEDKIQEPYSTSKGETSLYSSRSFSIDFIQDHSSDYKPGIVLPPPEVS